jgi:uncharacterized membrane protein YjgN (DUF898 family)
MTSSDNDLTSDSVRSVDDIRALPFEFRGDGTEYFKIWIVNVLLTIATLGIYSAWAKVRNNRYFYSNTFVDGSSFSYLAKPMQILKSRIIAVLVLMAYIVLTSLQPMLAVVLLIFLLFIFPFIFNQSRAFQLRHTAYKNIQFRFKGDYGEAFAVLFLWPLFGLLSLGILYPMAVLKFNKYVIENSAFGTTTFKFSATYKDYLAIFIGVIGFGLGTAILVALVGMVLPALAMIVVMVMYFVIFVYIVTSITNLFYSASTLSEHGFTCEMNIAGYAKVLCVNFFLIVVTFGLYLPAAKVRVTKYISSCLTLNAKGSLDDFAAAEQENVSAFGEQFGEVMDFGG